MASLAPLQESIRIAAPPARVWTVLTTPEGQRRVFYGNTIRTTWRPGDRLEFVGPGPDGPETVHIYGQVLRCEPGRELSYVEHPGAVYQADHARLSSRITYRIAADGTGTRVDVTHDEWAPGHPAHERSKGIWPALLLALKKAAET